MRTFENYLTIFEIGVFYYFLLLGLVIFRQAILGQFDSIKNLFSFENNNGQFGSNQQSMSISQHGPHGDFTNKGMAWSVSILCGMVKVSLGIFLHHDGHGIMGISWDRIFLHLR